MASITKGLPSDLTQAPTTVSSGLSDGSIAAIVIGILVIIIVVLFFVGIVGWYIASRGKKERYIVTVTHRESHLSEPHYVQSPLDKNRTESVALQEAGTGGTVMTYKNTDFEEKDDGSKSKQPLEDETGGTEEKMGEEKKMEEKEEVVGRERQDTSL